MAEKQNIKGSITSFNTYHTDAYMIAVKNGFEGTEAEWLASLKGPKGDTGERGEKGEKGDTYTLTETDKTEIAGKAAEDLGVVQTPGDSETQVMSQKATTDELDKVSLAKNLPQFMGEPQNYLEDLSSPNVEIFETQSTNLEISMDNETKKVSATLTSRVPATLCIKVKGLEAVGYDISFTVESGIVNSAHISLRTSTTHAGYGKKEMTLDGNTYTVKNCNPAELATFTGDACIVVRIAYNSGSITLGNIKVTKHGVAVIGDFITEETAKKINEVYSAYEPDKGKYELEWVIPSRLDYVVGKKGYFYYDGMAFTESEDWYKRYHMYQHGDINALGAQESVYVLGRKIDSFTASVAGQSHNRIFYIDYKTPDTAEGRQQTDSFVLETHNPISNPTAKKNILVVGDSYLGACIWLPWVVGSYLSECTNLNFIGTRNLSKLEGFAPVKYQGDGGYTWQNYVDDPSTLPSGYPLNPFWINGKLDYKAYVDQYAGEGENLDYLILCVGLNSFVNGTYFSGRYGNDIPTAIADMRTLAQRMIDEIHTQYPSCKILLVGYPYTPTEANARRYNTYTFNKAVAEMNKLYNELSNTYETFVRFVQTSAMVNKETSHPLTDIAVDGYTTIQSARSHDYVHLDEKGYKQYGDAVYRGLCGLFDME